MQASCNSAWNFLWISRSFCKNQIGCHLNITCNTHKFTYWYLINIHILKSGGIFKSKLFFSLNQLTSIWANITSLSACGIKSFNGFWKCWKRTYKLCKLSIESWSLLSTCYDCYVPVGSEVPMINHYWQLVFLCNYQFQHNILKRCCQNVNEGGKCYVFYDIWSTVIK